jgi:L-cysteine S-thiosulfotransferase
MRRPMRRLLLGCLAWALAAGAAAQGAPATPPAPPDPRRSGFEDMQPGTQALQRDDAQNPAMLWVAEGAERWRKAAGAAGPSCFDCHGEAAKTMRGVAARYPRYDAQTARPVTLAGRIRQCLTERQQAAAPPPESDVLLALETYVAFQSRGLPIAPDPDPRLDRHRAAGAALWQRPFGQLALACTQCHDALAGRRLAGNTIPQAHPVGYPLYRLEWQTVGSLERRLRNCLTGVRAEPFAYGSLEHAQLAAYLMQRAAGMAVETPAVRP